MKPAVTWVVMANARAAKVMENRGPGRGLFPLDHLAFIAAPAPRPRLRSGDDILKEYEDQHVSLARQRKVDARFASMVVSRLRGAFLAEEFDYLVLVAGPHMLRLLRAEMEGSLRPVLAGEIPKDLSCQPHEALEEQVGEIIPV